MPTNYLAIARQFTRLSENHLTQAEQDIFTEILNQLYISMADGNSCLELNKTDLDIPQSIEVIKKSNLAHEYIGKLPDKLVALPLSLWRVSDKVFLFFTRYLAYEYRIFQNVTNLVSAETQKQTNRDAVIDKLRELQKTGIPNTEQLNAIIKSCENKFNIISGGPGTGKTTTVMLLLWALYQLYGNELKVKICAPTGKAAIRVRDSMLAQINSFKEKNHSLDMQCFDSLTNDSKSFGTTIHKLLGVQQNNIYFRHGIDNPLDVDVLIVDESSMIGLPLFSKLLDAVNYTQIKHIIFLGDQNQLSSVEEGYVFASLVNLNIEEANDNPRDLLDFNQQISLASKLLISNRNNALIANIANLILNTQSDKLIKELNKYNMLHELKLSSVLGHILHGHHGLINYIEKVQTNIEYYLANQTELFKLFNQQSNLCCTNVGIFGTENLNNLLEQQIKQKFAIASEWYTGRAIMILHNDYSLGLSNGDVGICVIHNDVVKILFDNNRAFIPEILPKYSQAFAITIHKSQGSEYESVNVILPKMNNTEKNSLLSKELLYTAITRAKNEVNVFGTEETIKQAVSNKIIRSSGIAYMSV